MVDSNPYSRLMALQRMGIVENYERIRGFSVAIVVCIFCFACCFSMDMCVYILKQYSSPSVVVDSRTCYLL